jgi:hypothetical protein
MHTFHLASKLNDDSASVVCARAIYVMGSDNPQNTENTSSSAAGPPKPLDTDAANDEEPSRLKTPDVLTSEERLKKTLHELCGMIVRLEAEAKTDTAVDPSLGPAGASSMGDVPVKQEVTDTILEHAEKDTSQSKCNSIIIFEIFFDALS